MSSRRDYMDKEEKKKTEDLDYELSTKFKNCQEAKSWKNKTEVYLGSRWSGSRGRRVFLGKQLIESMFG